MNKEYYVYRHYIKDNTFYIGSNYRKCNPNRAYEYGRNSVWEKIILDNNGKYDVEIIKYFDNAREAFEYEISLIHYYHDIGQCQANFEDRRGKNNPMFNKKHTEESKKENAKKHLGRKLSDEHKKKISNSSYWKGKRLPSYIREKMSQSRKGKIPKNAIEKRKRKVRLYIEDKIIDFNSKIEMSRYLKSEYSIDSRIIKETPFKNNNNYDRLKKIEGAYIKYIDNEI